MDRGAPKGRAQGARALALGTYPALDFQDFFPLNYVICMFAARVRTIFVMWEGR